MITRVTGAGDSRLAPYRLVANPDALRREGLFVAEGRLVLPELLASPFETHSVLLSEAAFEQLRDQLGSSPDVQVFVAPSELLSEIGGHDFHRGCLALGKMGSDPIFTDLGSGPILVLDHVSNPDNIGGIFRSARAFGVAEIVLGPECGDPLYRKAIRTSMGATLRVPWRVSTQWPDDVRAFQRAGGTVIALTPHPQAEALADAVARAGERIGFLLGAEGDGLTEETMRLADARARIPIAAQADSLNVAAAAAIAMYEAQWPRVVRAVR